MTVRQKKPEPVPSSKSPDVQFGDVDLISDFEQSDVKVKIQRSHRMHRVPVSRELGN